MYKQIPFNLNYPIKMWHLLAVGICCLCMTYGNQAKAQSEALDSLHFNLMQQDYQLEKTGMKILAAWSVGNFAVSGGMLLAGEGHNPSFYRTNIYWNLVNVGLATSALIRNKPPSSDKPFSFKSFNKHYTFEKTLLLNAGLDAGYIAAGLWMNERGKRIGGKSGFSWQGMGQSLIVQGAFLLVFDTVLHQLFSRNKKRFLKAAAF